MGEFPPTSVDDIAGYSIDDVVEGYRDWRLDDPEPGENRAAGYRWGWVNAKRDATGEVDPFDALRHQYYRATRAAA